MTIINFTDDKPLNYVYTVIYLDFLKRQAHGRCHFERSKYFVVVVVLTNFTKNRNHFHLIFFSVLIFLLVQLFIYRYYTN